MLLPDTSAEGAQSFAESIAAQVQTIPVGIDSCTYPQDVFEHVLNERTDKSVSMEFIAEASAQRSAGSLAAKRLLDIVGALSGIILLSPFMLATALAVAFSSPGPIIFRQQRLGRGGKPFTFMKFRSMRTGNDDKAHREYVANLIEGNLDEINQGDADKTAI